MNKLKKIIALLSALILLSLPLCSCNGGGGSTGNSEKTSESARESEKTSESEPTEQPEPTKEVIDLKGQTELASSVTYAVNAANSVQAYYKDNDYERGEYVVENAKSKFSHVLRGSGKTVGYFGNSRGKPYLENTMDVYAVSGAERIYAKKSGKDARANTTDFGYYYYAVNVRDLEFDGLSCHLEKIYHTYPDKIHEQFRVVSGGAADVTAYGFEVKASLDEIAGYEIKDGNGVHSSADNIDERTVEYVALDVKNVGVIGFIFVNAEKVSVVISGRYLVIRQEISVDGTAMPSGADVSFGNRIYNDETHSFDGIKAASELERNPLDDKNIEVTDKDSAKYVGYDYLKGCYEFYLGGEGFNAAYYKDQEKKFEESVRIKGDDKDRTAYIYVHTDYPLEGAALLDENDAQVPVPVQVSKNFGHEKEEPIYDPYDKIYGDSYLPIVIEKNSTKKFTVVNVYMKWGKYNIKQLSSISYYISYYHLSTGVHETNCIAPYYALKGPSLGYGSFGKSWFLPDFRSASGNMWQNGDPQFSSAGMLMSVNSDFGSTLCEYTGSDIRSSGLTYADLDYSYVSDDGAFEYTMRHVEMPQADENRTYYRIYVRFLKDVTYEKGSFSLASFNGRNCTYKYSSYLDENGKEKQITNATKSGATIYKLNKNSSYFTLYGIEQKEQPDMSNFGLIVKNSKIVVGGKESNVNLGYLNDWQDKLNYGSLTLSEDVSFKAGDYIDTDVIFLSYGKVGQTHCDNVKQVYNDSVVNPITISPTVGKTVIDGYIPTVEAAENKAEFTLNGGVDGDKEVNYSVKVTGITKLSRPKLYENVNGEWVEVKLSSDHGYDGYSVIAENGKLTYSFVFTQNRNGKTFRLIVE